MEDGRKKFDNVRDISERHTANDFITAYMEAAAAAAALRLPSKPRPKCSVSWKSLVVKKKCDNLKTKHPRSIKETTQIPKFRNLRKPTKN